MADFDFKIVCWKDVAEFAWSRRSFSGSRRPRGGMDTLLVDALVFFLTVNCCLCLRMVMLDVPTATHQGDSVELSCIYDLNNDSLYSIKWYKNDIEFYRYVPNDWPPGQFLPLPGIRVDLSKSGRRSVFLRSVDLNSTGTYRCEVSAESPSFKTVEAERDMNVMVLPTEGPKISGGELKYSVGDTVSINCTSAKSKPAPTLKWFINNLLVGPDYETEYSTTLHSDGLETSSLTLRFVAKEAHFVAQNMRLKCTASIARVYTMSDEELYPRQQNSALQVVEDDSRENPLIAPPSIAPPKANLPSNVGLPPSPGPTSNAPAASVKKKGPKNARSSDGTSTFQPHHLMTLILPTVALLRYLVT